MNGAPDPQIPVLSVYGAGSYAFRRAYRSQLLSSWFFFTVGYVLQVAAAIICSRSNPKADMQLAC